MENKRNQIIMTYNKLVQQYLDLLNKAKESNDPDDWKKAMEMNQQLKELERNMTPNFGHYISDKFTSDDQSK